MNAANPDNLTQDDVLLVCNSSNANILSSNEFSLRGGSFDDVQDVLNNAHEGDTIYFDGEFYSSSNSSLIKVKKNVNLVSNSGAVFNGRGQSGILYIYPTSTGTVISGLTFINGYRVIASAAYVDCQNVTFKNCVFENNTGFWNGGGAIATTYDSINASGLTVEKCIFRGNTAPVSSGALAAFSTDYKIIDCIFENNYVENNMSKSNFGGALVVGSNFDGVTGIISKCLFKNNYAKSGNNEPSNGGAIDLRQKATLSDCFFEGNFADNGGAISCRGNNTVINCTFKNNNANYGGAVYINETTIIEKSNFEGNNAHDGGSIYCLNHGQINVITSIFKNNYAENNGGAINLQTEKSLINSNNFTKNAAKYNGGALNIQTNDGLIKNNNFKENNAGYGGSIYTINLSKIQIINDNYQKNKAKNGSAIYNNGILNVLNTKFNNNQAKSFKLQSKDYKIQKGKTLVVEAYLEYGDNFPGIYSNNSLIVDNKNVSLLNGALNQIIILKISNKIYKSKTNKSGIAVFKIPTNKLKIKKYTVAIIHEESQISTKIKNNLHVTIKEKTKLKQKNTKKTNYKKSISKVKKTNLPVKCIISKKSKIKTIKKNKRKSVISKKVINRKVNNNQQDNWLVSGYKSISDFLSTPIFTISNYKKTLDSWGWAGSVVGFCLDFLIGIDEHGKLSIGDLALTLISVFCGVGLILRGAKIGFKLLKYSKRIIKFAKKSRVLTKIFKFFNNGKNFLISKFHYFSKLNTNKLYNSLKKVGLYLNKSVSFTSKVFGWLSNPPKKIVNTIFNKLINKYKNTGKILTIFGMKFHFKTIVNSFDKFLNNPARTIKGAFFPNINKIKDNINTAYNWINSSYKHSKNRITSFF